MMKSFSFLLVLLIPAAMHAQTFQVGGGGMQISSGGSGAASTSGASQNHHAGTADSVEVAYVGTESDTTVHVTTDSASKLLKGSHAQVVFIKTIPAAGDPQPAVRSTRQALAKIPLSRMTNITFNQGDALVKQYGDVAKNGLVTVTIKAPPPVAKSQKKS